ncbi:MAG: hypothetical protein RL140_412 [Actinomycetota bacterium]|jgi:hypothetical protein
MKNNSLAMLATISIAMGLASIIGYVEPTACVVSGAEVFQSCEEVANQHIWGFVGFTSFGVLTFLFGLIRSRRRK